MTVRGATGEERAWLEVALQACAAELVDQGGEVVVAGSLATRRDRATALSIGDVEAIWTVLGSLSGLAIAPAPVAETPPAPRRLSPAGAMASRRNGRVIRSVTSDRHDIYAVSVSVPGTKTDTA